MSTDEKQANPSLADLCSDFFVLGLQIQNGQVELPDAQSLKQNVLLLFDSLKAKGKQYGILATDIEEASFALAAFLDEIIQYSNWPGKQVWAAHPLQADLFSESRAGVRFFERLEKLRRSSPHVVEVFYICLTLGFMGEYRLEKPEKQGALIQDLCRDVAREGLRPLSPHVKPPAEGGFNPKTLPLIPMAVVSVGIGLLVYVILYLLLSSSYGDGMDYLLEQIGRS